MQTILQVDLKFTAFKKRKAQLLSQTTKAKQLSKANFLLYKLKNSTQPPVLWTDEELFIVQAIYNNQNNRIYAQRKEDIPVNERVAYQHRTPASVMVWAGVTSTVEKTHLIFIEVGVKINQHVYLKLLKEQLIPWINRTLKEWHHPPIRQSRISYHKQCSQCSQTRLVLGKYGSIQWIYGLPSLPDINPMDFAIWSISETNSYSSSHQSETSLKAKLRHC